MATFGEMTQEYFNPLDARSLEKERHRRALAEWERSQTQVMDPAVRQWVESQLSNKAGPNVKAMTQAENAVRNSEEQSLTNPALNRSPHLTNLYALQQLQQGLYSEPGFGAPKPHIPVRPSASPIDANEAGQLYPTAGNYTNGAFNAFMMKNRIQEPTMQGVVAAQDEAFQRSPEVVKANAKIQAEQLKAQNALEKQRRDLEGKTLLQAAKGKDRLDAINLRAKLKSSPEAFKSAEKVSQKAYKDYVSAYKQINNYRDSVTGLGYSAEEKAKILKENGIDYKAMFKGGPPAALSADEFVKTKAHQDVLQKMITQATPEGREGIKQYYKSNGMTMPTEAEVIEGQVAGENFTPESAKVFAERVKPLADAGDPKFQAMWKAFEKHHGALWSVLSSQIGLSVPGIAGAAHGQDPQPLSSGDPMRYMNSYNGIPPGTPNAFQQRGR